MMGAMMAVVVVEGGIFSCLLGVEVCGLVWVVRRTEGEKACQ